MPKIAYGFGIIPKEPDRMKRPKFNILQAHHGRICPYCAKVMVFAFDHPHRPTRDHVLPKIRGGNQKPNNRLIVCALCNTHKGYRTLIEWHRHLDRIHDPRAMFVWAVIQAKDIAGFTMYEPEETTADERILPKIPNGVRVDESAVQRSDMPVRPTEIVARLHLPADLGADVRKPDVPPSEPSDT